jgi:putative salt-induced outer membrane protein YdiY
MDIKSVFAIGAVLAAAGVASARIDNELGDIFQPEKPAAPAAPADPETFWDGWHGGVEAGITGSSGNSEVLNARAAITGERKTSLMVTKGSATYVRNQEGSTATKNRFEVAARNDWIFEKGSPWRYFVTGTYEYDDFQDWDHRITLGNGIGYAFIENDKTTLLGRAGIGVRREIGGADNRWIPEGILGVDFSHKLTERQKITASVDYYPSLLDFPEDFRVVTKAAWEIVVDPEIKMSLKVGAEHRHDSEPGGGSERNDVDYFALLVWSY